MTATGHVATDAFNGPHKLASRQPRACWIRWTEVPCLWHLALGKGANVARRDFECLFEGRIDLLPRSRRLLFADADRRLRREAVEFFRVLQQCAISFAADIAENLAYRGQHCIHSGSA